MAVEGYLGEVMLFAGNYAPQGWLVCDGKKLSISKYPALYGVIGASYGGDAKVDFCIPDLRGVFPTSASKPNDVGKRKASAVDSEPGVVAITAANLPGHVHTATFTGTEMAVRAPVSLKARQVAGTSAPAKGSYLGEGGAGTAAASIYVPANSNAGEVELGGASLSTTITPLGNVTVGSSAPGAVQPLQVPFIQLQFCICIEGVYPVKP